MFKKLIGWWLDYAYIIRWSVQDFFIRSDTRQFLTPRGEVRCPIVLIPGVYENWQFLRPVAKVLFEAGHPIHILDRLGYNTGKIPTMAEIVAQYIVQHDLRDVIIVAHSKGGLIAKYAVSEYELKSRVLHTIAINSPFSGSKYAYLFILPSIRTFAPRNKIIQQLTQNETVNARITSIYSHFDPHIPEKSYLAGAENIELPQTGHFKPIGTKELQEVVMHVVSNVEKEAK